MKNPFDHDITPADAPLLNVQVDGVWMKFPKGLNAVEAARRVQKFIPHYCYHPKLSISGNCRMCLVELGMPKLDAERKPVLAADGKPEISWMPRQQIGCATLIAEGMGIRTESPMVDECRKGVMEFLLINHPLDCPICDQAGECKLQEYSVQYGNEGSRFTDDKVKKPKRVDIGERIVLDDERCIMCSRCIRFSKEMVHDDVLGFTERGSHTTLAVHPGKRLDNNYSLNTVDICPVGALTSKDFRFQMRVWFLKETKSVCTSCATGCNVIVGSREEKVYRYEPRQNDAVNSCWMCDAGRLNYKWIGREDRLKSVLVRGQKSTWTAALNEIGDKLKKVPQGSAAIVASARQTNEELWLISKLKSKLGAMSDSVARTGEGDKLLVSADKNLNTNGARLTGICFTEIGSNLPQIVNGISSGRIKTLLVFGEDVTKHGIGADLLGKLETLIVSDILPNATTRPAHYLLPGCAHAEKRGSFTNTKGQVQKFIKAVEAPS